MAMTVTVISSADVMAPGTIHPSMLPIGMPPAACVFDFSMQSQHCGHQIDLILLTRPYTITGRATYFEARNLKVRQD